MYLYVFIVKCIHIKYFLQQPNPSPQPSPATSLSSESPKPPPKEPEPQKPDQVATKQSDDLFASFEESSSQNRSAAVRGGII